MHTKKLVIGVFLVMFAIVGFGLYSIIQSERISLVDTDAPLAATSDYKDATYTVGGRAITLVDGSAEIRTAPDSASKTTVRYFGNEFRKDMNGDGEEDVAFLITEDTGGSGTFFYVVVAVKDGDTYRGSEALFLGDRIAPQSTDDGPERSFVVNYADRIPGEDFTVSPSVGKSIYVLLKPETMELGEWVVDFEGESNSGGKLKADVFTGTLEVVDTGCFADGECFIVVDGKHVTAIRGWSRDTVGSVRGVEGFGDLESYIGSEVEVYAHDLGDGTYTLYGSEGFYIKLLGDDSASDDGDGGQGIAVGEPHPGIPGGGTSDEPKPQIVRGGCMVGGCSSQLCGEPEVMRDIATTCEYRAEYACYQVATCERQTNGQCGWTTTPELTQCLRDAQNEPVMEAY